MAFTNDDAGDLLEQLAKTRAEGDALRRALIEHAGALAAAQHLGDAAYGPIMATSLAIEVDDKGRVAVKVTDPAGRARTKFDSATRRFAAVTVADLAAELKARWPQLAKQEQSAPTDDKASDPQNLTELMRAQREQERKATTAPLSESERSSARSRNPWRQGPMFNLTEQMKLERRDSGFAAILKEAAREAA